MRNQNFQNLHHQATQQTYIQTQLSQLGFRIRKSVSEGYKVGKKRDMNGDSIEMDSIRTSSASNATQQRVTDYFDAAR